MHILIFSTDQSIRNQNSAVAKRMRRYAAMVESIDIIVQGADSEVPIALDPKVTVHPIVSSSKPVVFFRALSLAKKLAKDGTIISVQDPFELGIWGVMASIYAGCRLHVQVHIDFMSPNFSAESLRQRFQAWIAPFVLRRAHAIRAVSQKIAVYIRDELGVSARKITVAPVFVDIEGVQAAPVTVDLHVQFPKWSWIVLVASRYVKQKNIPLAIEAFSIFARTHMEAGLVIVGSGPEEAAIRRAIVEYGLEDQAVIGSWTKEFASCMKTCDVFLLSSDYEGWGMTVIEAAALARPIIMTDVGCADEFLIHEENGVVVPTRDPIATTDALQKYYSDRAFGRRMGQAAKDRALSYMTQAENDSLIRSSWQHALPEHSAV